MSGTSLVDYPEGPDGIYGDIQTFLWSIENGFQEASWLEKSLKPDNFYYGWSVPGCLPEVGH